MALDELDTLRAKAREIKQERGLPPDDKPALRSFDLALEMNLSRFRPGSSVLDAPDRVESLWGDGHQSLWAKGESLLLVGPDGAGKTTLAQQLVCCLIALGESSLLGFTVQEREKVLYIAADRPAQAWRSFRRMVTEEDRAVLDERLEFWRGPLPFDLAQEPEALLAMATRVKADVVVVDSLKDVAADLSREESGLGLNKARQLCCAEGVDVLELHHQRKAQAGGGKPNKLADVYGSRWLTAGAGSVVMLWGEAGDPVIDLGHLKPPDEPVGPFQIEHDHLRGRTTVVEHVDAYTVVLKSQNGATAQVVAQAVYGSTDRNSVAKARRQLERLHGEKKIHKEERSRGGSGGRESALYFPISLLRQGGGERG